MKETLHVTDTLFYRPTRHLERPGVSMKLKLIELTIMNKMLQERLVDEVEQFQQDKPD